jgi:hypothetical protein
MANENELNRSLTGMNEISCYYWSYISLNIIKMIKDVCHNIVCSHLCTKKYHLFSY